MSDTGSSESAAGSEPLEDRRDLQGQRKARTRQEIVDAVIRLLETDHPAELSMPRIAEESGVSLRTLYRYFPTKSALIDETSKWMNKLATPGQPGLDDLRGMDVTDLLTRQWNDFDRNIGGIRAQHISAAGRDIRRHRIDPVREVAGLVLDAETPDLDPEHRSRIIDACLAVTSSSMYLELVDRMGYSSNEAASLASWLTEAVRAHAANTRSSHPTGNPHAEE